MKNKAPHADRRKVTDTPKSAAPPHKGDARPRPTASAKQHGAHAPKGKDATSRPAPASDRMERPRGEKAAARKNGAPHKPERHEAPHQEERRPAAPRPPEATRGAAPKRRPEKKFFAESAFRPEPSERGEKPARPVKKQSATAQPYPAGVEASRHERAAARPGKSAGAPHREKSPARRDAAAGRPAHEGPALRAGQTLELTINAINDDGFGVSHHEGTRILVAHALPGEQVVVRVTYVGRRETFANLLKCVKRSADRVDRPLCSKGRVCDGCGLMQMRYPTQLAWKRELVAKNMRQYPSLSHVAVHDTIASPQEFGYRNSAKLVVAGKSADPVIGMYKRNSHDVLENLDCPLHHPLINKVVKAAKAGIKKGKVPIYNPKSEMGLLRYLVVRVAQPGDRVMVVLVTSEVGYNEMHHLAKYIQQEVPEVCVVAQNINNTTGNVIFGQRDRFLTKAQTLRAQIGKTAFSLSPRSFFQVNSGAARIIYEKVRELAALKGTERVIDLYCGIGGISLLLAKDADEVVGIELVEAAVIDATDNAKLNRIDNCEFVAGDAARLLDEIGAEGGADLIVLNPPRKGCDEKVLKSAAALKPEKMIYVSCSPETLARDLDILSRLGYRTLQVQPVDMFPQTVHVEDVALLERVPVT